jgi:hypothetical protein
MLISLTYLEDFILLIVQIHLKYLNSFLLVISDFILPQPGWLEWGALHGNVDGVLKNFHAAQMFGLWSSIFSELSLLNIVS